MFPCSLGLLRAASPTGRALRAPPATTILNSQWSFRCAHKFACGAPLLIGLTTACFRHRRRPSCAPYQFPLKSYGFPGAETARKRFLLWKMGFSDAVYCEPMHPSIQHGRSTALASSLAVLPASLGLLRAVSPTGRALRAPPPYTPPGTIEVRKGFALLSRSPLSFLTVCGNGKFCQRLFRCMRSAKSSLCLGDFFLFNRTNLRGFDIS